MYDRLYSKLSIMPIKPSFYFTKYLANYFFYHLLSKTVLAALSQIFFLSDISLYDPSRTKTD